jgi:3-oxoacyl-[acyl-carrier protein] reductase
MDKDLDAAFSLVGRVAVVTGAASGLGRETARVLAKAGGRLILVDVDERGLGQTQDLIVALGADAASQVVDVTRRDQVEALADGAVQASGRIDIWANVAGVGLQGAVFDTSEEELDRVLAVNAKGVYWGCAAAGRVMKAQGGGVIVNVSSGGGDAAIPGLSAYGMSKAAVNLLTRTCAMEFGPFGVRVNAVAPGWIDTQMGSQLYRNAAGEVDEALRDRVVREQVQASPLGLTGEPGDIALAILYLASDASRYVTGHILRADGGCLI